MRSLCDRAVETLITGWSPTYLIERCEADETLRDCCFRDRDAARNTFSTIYNSFIADKMLIKRLDLTSCTELFALASGDLNAVTVARYPGERNDVTVVGPEPVVGTFFSETDLTFGGRYWGSLTVMHYDDFLHYRSMANFICKLIREKFTGASSWWLLSDDKDYSFESFEDAKSLMIKIIHDRLENCNDKRFQVNHMIIHISRRASKVIN